LGGSAATALDSLLHAPGTDIQMADASHATLTAAAPNSILVGGAASGVLTGGSGFSVLIAGSGAERLVAGSGSNDLEGGSGADTFVFGTAGAGHDVVAGFKPGTDHIEIDGAAAGTTAQSLIAAATADAQGEAVLHLGQHDIVLHGITPAHLDPGWFLITH